MKTTELFIPIKPVPAARVRVTRFGSYFPKTYTDFRNEMYSFLSKIKSKYPANSSMYSVDLVFIMKKPKSPSNFYPVSDVDNLAKGVLDSLVKCEMFFNDDIQIIALSAQKRYQHTDESYGIKVIVNELSLEEAIALVE